MIIAFCQGQESIPTVGFHRTNWDNGASVAEAFTYTRIYENKRSFWLLIYVFYFPFHSAIESFNQKALARQQQADMGAGDDGAERPTTGRDEWGEDDGAEVSDYFV